MSIDAKGDLEIALRKIILLLGGARSGKSRYAQELAQKTSGKVLFVATASAGDEDMRRRILKHQNERPPSWRTLEATAQIGRYIEKNIGDAQVVIIDCITLLVNNLFFRKTDRDFDNIDESLLEKEVIAEVQELLFCFKKIDASYIIVSNEVGLGLVPDNRMGRLYRDILGRANQMLARDADEVFFMVAGIPLKVKPATASE
jgi:adenosylcobinamide kinase / adenosylcobinamide-phosphate guanylyltransferase